MKKLRRNMRGDTIVEVLISIAVASAVLGGAYVVVNRTLQNSQQAQEHSEALSIAQGQLEQLKKIAATDNSVFSSTQPVHCIGLTDGALHQLTVHALPAADPSYPAACKSDATAGPGYRTAFIFSDKGNVNPFDDDFTVYVNWPSATGRGEDTVTLKYRVNQ